MDLSNQTLQLATQLINRESVSPEDNGCQNLLIGELQKMGFSVQKLPSGKVSNFWARRGGQGPLLIFAGHTDVVPPGPLEKWHSPPFQEPFAMVICLGEALRI